MIYHETVTDELGLALRQGVKQSNQLGKPILVSVVEQIAPFDPLALMARGVQLTNARTFWAQPDGELTLVGLGVAHAFDGVESTRFRRAAEDWRQLLAGAVVGDPRGLPGVGPLLLGGFAFDAQRPTSELWQHFPHARLVLPKLIFAKHNDTFWLTRSVIVDAESDIEFEQLTLNEFAGDVIESAPHSSKAQPNAAAIPLQELVSGAEWQEIVGEAVKTIRRGDLEKVVLARAVRLDAPNDFEPTRALEHFSQHAPGTYQFAFVREDDCFLGATPEQLVRVRGGKLETMGLAGSMPRGASPEQDVQFGDEMLASAKDRNEQEIVVRAMREILGDTCVQLQMNATPKLMKLASIQHLVTRFSGTLANGNSILDLVERLHPTPAVGGRPRAASLEWLRDHEKLDRGWYAGAIGWMDANLEGEFVVAIRSALLQKNQAMLFAGCGIVADSVPAREYAESQLKLKPMLAALGANGTNQA